MYIDQSYFVWFCCLLNIFCSGTTNVKLQLFSELWEKMVELPPSEGGEATITAMSALAAVGQYLSTNSAKLPHDQDMQAQNNVISTLQTQVRYLTETLYETRTTIVLCHQDMHGFDTGVSDICYVFQEPRRNEGEGYGAPSDNTS